MSLTRLHCLENEVWLIRNRGFSIFESPSMKGPEGHFFLKGKHVTPQDVRAFARQLEERAKLKFNSVPPIIPAAEAFRTVPITIAPKPKEQPMPDLLRGMNEADVRADMKLLGQEHGGHPRAAIAAGVGKSGWSNCFYGVKRISHAMMEALYGPEGTALRAQIRKAVEPVVDTGCDNDQQFAGVTVDQLRTILSSSPMVPAMLVQPDVPAQGGDAHEVIDEPATVPDWMAPAIDALRQKRTDIGQQVWELEQKLDKINAAERSLLELAA